MAKSKTEAYREFLQKALDSGMYKMQAARELKKKFPHLSMTTCITHVYQWFPAKFNNNYDRKVAALERKAEAEEEAVKENAVKQASKKKLTKKAPSKKPAPRAQKVNREKKSAPTEAPAATKTARPKKKPIPKNIKDKTPRRKNVDGTELFF